ncbi:hypothetical protein AGMMS50229_06920 [Campylobacterota bacterium]|nr:hypothetical protein AGMMS50229_06920 [Campylobacterota bacterium]
MFKYLVIFFLFIQFSFGAPIFLGALISINMVDYNPTSYGTYACVLKHSLPQRPGSTIINLKIECNDTYSDYPGIKVCYAYDGEREEEYNDADEKDLGIPPLGYYYNVFSGIRDNNQNVPFDLINQLNIYYCNPSNKLCETYPDGTVECKEYSSDYSLLGGIVTRPDGVVYEWLTDGFATLRHPNGTYLEISE